MECLMMKVVAFNGSPRKNGNTVRLINKVFEQLNTHNVETELIQLGGEPVRGCMACGQCRVNQNSKCVIDDDIINTCIAKMIAADCIIIGSPTYFSNVTAEVKALIDRAGYVTRGNGYLLRRKLGAAIVAVRRAGALITFNAINDFFLINEMIIPGSSYWNLGIGREPGDVETDAEGLNTMNSLAENIAWLLKKIKD